MLRWAYSAQVINFLTALITFESGLTVLVDIRPSLIFKYSVNVNMMPVICLHRTKLFKLISSNLAVGMLGSASKTVYND